MTQWRALEEWLRTPDLQDRIAREFPMLARLRPEMDRRGTFRFLAGAIALAGLDGCERKADEDAYPMARMPEGSEPGNVRHYASAVELDGVGQPIIGTCRDGRPIKLEGNPRHPASGGATDAFTQAALLGLYDPFRSAAPQKGRETADWDAAARVLQDLRQRLDARRGEGFRLLTGAVGSPTLLRQIAAMKARWPAMHWHVHAPASAAPIPLTVPIETVLYLDRTEALVCLDADPLGNGPLQTWHAQGWAARRRAFQDGQANAALMVAEPTPTLTGTMGQERLVASHGRIEPLLAALERRIAGGAAEGLSTREIGWVDQAAALLEENRGRGLVLVGAQHGQRAQARVAALNDLLGNGRLSGEWGAREGDPEPEDFASLVMAMRSGTVGALLFLDTNPVYSAAPDLAFGQAMGKVALRVHAGLHRDETARHCHWHLPLAHLLESWSDVRCAEGSASVVQPLVRPFLDVRSRHEILAMVLGAQGATRGRDLVRETWGEAAADDAGWQSILLGGIVEERRRGKPAATGARAAAPALAQVCTSPPGYDVLFRPDPTVHDGSLAGNPWLQEMPKPLTKLTWDNAIHVSPAIAEAEGLENEDLVEVRIGDARIEGPVWIVPGQAPQTILLHLGYGRRAGGEVALGCGFDVHALQSSASPSYRGGARLRKLGGKQALACTQTHWALGGHDWVREVDEAGESLPPKPERANFYLPQERAPDEPAWAMAIDLDLCLGCNACAVACVAENNVPMVGKEQVAKGREMHWLRIDRYYEGTPEAPEHRFQPVPCMHCEDAPCETGCPVNATVHSPDGLNLQVYNRCIGTRTCSAYCPYKVRRFNWLDYTRSVPEELKAQRNPEVTVRDRGVMEKCTYCIQRITQARIEADKENRPLRDGDVLTACQQACPTQAIVFGDLSTKGSAVGRRKADGRNYALLGEANTRPRTTYGARIKSGKGKA
ncbi:Fe-S-cluster-containing hydrogenase (plasmid) [Novosphingobium sp. BL-8A]|uniref:Fe-S-cluster-containing hydrogenase n=1 Tax=Novosphingobium sp. BL-8A TaxID=3127639 RepID=UPI003756BE9B